MGSPLDSRSLGTAAISFTTGGRAWRERAGRERAWLPIPRRTSLLLFICFGCIWRSTLAAQSDLGELHLTVLDPAGAALPSHVDIESDAGDVHRKLSTDGRGVLDVSRLPFGRYQVRVVHDGFAPQTQVFELHSALPTPVQMTLHIQGEATSVEVRGEEDTLIDPEAPGEEIRLGREAAQQHPASLPGRTLINIVAEQPGWVIEGNAVLHPRGSEYQTQYVIDGVPLTDNRSPGFNTEIGAEQVQSIGIYTAGIPAEFGRKLGGVVEVTTAHDVQDGLHLDSELDGGSFRTLSGSVDAGYGWARRNTLTAGAQLGFTAWYANPPVTQNYTNQGDLQSFLGGYERRWSPGDRLTFQLRDDTSRSLVPNEQLQQTAGQVQHRNTDETMGILSYQHIFNPELLGDLRVMVRDDSTNLNSNPASTPIIAAQDRGFRESYVKASVTGSPRHQEWKAGVEAGFTNLHESFSDTITDPTQFDSTTASSFTFAGLGHDREQGIFAQDRIHAGPWNLSVGLRWDHYKLLVRQDAWSPRVALSYLIPHVGMLVHVAYDRVFQTPAFENILLSSSAQVASLDSQFLRLPVQPSRGNHYEVGFTRAIAKEFRLEANGFIRTAANYADDDQLLDTSISFPISFRKAFLYGADGKLTLPHFGGFSGFVSYSYLVGSAYLPVTGGLFLGDDAATALAQTSGRIWVSQDQRNTVRSRLRYNLPHGVWVAAGLTYDSGLPTEFDGSFDDAVAQYGAALVARVDFERNRVRPALAAESSMGVTILQRDNRRISLEAGGYNLNNRLNLIDFAGLFSGNAVSPPRSWSTRLRYSY